MNDSPASVVRPVPKFFQEPLTFSTKKERNMTPRDKAPPPPRPSTKKTQSLSRVFTRRNVSRALPVSFKSPDKTMSTPCYNEGKKELYFDQCFEVICKLGSGSFGEVYKVRSKEDGIFYAIKRSRQRFKGNLDRLRKLEEVDKHEKLPFHRNCVKFVKAWEERRHLYIQTELCKMSLSSYAEEHHNIPESFVWNCLVDLLMAVKHLHDHNLVHMDIKPENVFISDDQICKLGDFGLVLDLNKQDEVTDAQEGDPKYLAPELLKGQFGKPADIFSLGITILELASDLDLPRGEDLWHQLRSDRLPVEFLQGKSEESKHTIRWMMEPNSKLRPKVDDILEHDFVKQIWKERMQGQIEVPSKSYESTPARRSFSKRSLELNQNFSNDELSRDAELSLHPLLSSNGNLSTPCIKGTITPRNTPKSHFSPHWSSHASSTSPLDLNEFPIKPCFKNILFPQTFSDEEDNPIKNYLIQSFDDESPQKHDEENSCYNGSPERKKLLF